MKVDIQKLQEKLTAAELAKSVMQDKLRSMERVQAQREDSNSSMEGKIVHSGGMSLREVVEGMMGKRWEVTLCGNTNECGR